MNIYHAEAQLTPLKYFSDEGLDSLVSDKSLKTGDLLTFYANMFKKPFFNIEAQGPFVSDEELRRWVAWCIYEGRSRDEYPLVNQD
ncbi:hypothetical protein [Bifidobacterium simiarum]|uniref:hypothetical protein n=1 Tax=Bifidobacterium simiarum TaxID=2045441 RepID=UPI001BDC3677|nr:hypothetical protein [Bifidobacterium simiarum]MBT1166734.1 hypothetical protein [Bifidobacterium simiarum]